MSFDAQCHRRFSHAFRMDEAVDDIVGEIEARLHERAEKEISSLELGELVWSICRTPAHLTCAAWREVSCKGL